MANPARQLTLSESIKWQHQHGDIDPAVTTFLRRKGLEIWERVKAQPPAYMPTREELAVLNNFCGVFGDDEIAQEDIPRFWEHHPAKLAIIQQQGESKKYHEMTPTSDLSFESYGEVPAAVPMFSAVDPAVVTSSFKDSVQLWQNPCKGAIPRPHEDQSLSKGSTAAYETRVAHGCEPCRQRKINCNGLRPICQHCKDFMLSCAYTDGKRHRTKKWLSCLAEIYEHRLRAASRKEVIESLKKFSKDLESKMPKENQIERSQNTFLLDSLSKRQDGLAPRSWRVGPGHLKSPETLSLGLSQIGMHVLNGEEYNIVNSMKLWVQCLTGESWDWWPLRQSFRPLLQDEIRIQWYCNLGHPHWTVISKTVFDLSLLALKSKATTQSAPSESKNPKLRSERNSSTSTRTSCSSRPETSAENSSSATSEKGSTDQTEDEAGSGKETNPSGAGTAVDIVPPSRLTGFVLFGVHGSKRLQSACLRLAQIDVAVYKDDDSFFDEMTVQYKRLRGFIRRIFSIWMFHTSNPNEIMPGPKEMPSPRDREYEYNASRNPPVLSTVFNANFYGCKKACIKSQLDMLCLFHQCKGRNHCGKYRVLDRLPKRRRKWDIDRDEEGEEAWGLNAEFAVSFYKVTLYHMLILMGPILFWGLWLKKWPSDWQNASVPFFAVVVLLSLFWLPFVHATSPADRRDRSKNKSI